MLKDKVAFITGSTSGIGWATAKTFASHGAVIVLNGRASQQRLDDRVKEISQEFGVRCIGLLQDVANPASVRACYAEIFKQFKRLDILVNNAGILRDGILGMITEATMRELVDVNLLGAMYNLQEASRLMVRNRSGSIINVSSIVGRVGNEGQSIYSATKAALIGLTLSAAKELAPKNVRVNAVAPGFIETELIKSLPEDKRGEWMRKIKMGRIGAPEDVANGILFLASDLAAYVTGQVLGVDGGLII